MHKIGGARWLENTALYKQIIKKYVFCLQVTLNFKGKFYQPAPKLERSLCPEDQVDRMESAQDNVIQTETAPLPLYTTHVPKARGRLRYKK